MKLSMLSKFIISILITCITTPYLYIAYQMSYKPWVETEFVLMDIRKMNEATRVSNNRDSMPTHEYIVKNPPYILKGRYEMVNDFLKEQGELSPKSGDHLITYVFSQEGWYFINSFPYVDYIDRSYLENPVTNQEYFPYYDGDEPTENIPYGGANGFSGRSVATFELDSVYSECLKRSQLIITQSLLHINFIANNIEYDDHNFGRYFFSNREAISGTPECQEANNS